MSIIWWEKTVEYYFVKKYVELDAFIAPLDGHQERAGDTILGNEENWILIEFKKDETCLTDECRKFTNYEEAKGILIDESSHHLVIYGESSGRDIDLVCQEYFSEEQLHIEDALSQGTDIDSFFEYVRKFVTFKKNSNKSSGGFGLVAGIRSDGTVTKCMKLSEFGQAMQLEQKLQAKLKPSPVRNRDPGPSWDR
ncbi:hypothetical protein [Teredinibacter turnerae]|uniref:hypothetical protein n=1 Tax=Teredinibacter turnerae TaxID=2426 RepID=UPI00041085AB|nr:hypothetical protein [Teredinibacter turnerae]